MQRTYVQRVRVVFHKMGPMRYTSHLDVARTWERILNRAKIPVDYSHGFNRRPKIQFATATALGTTSACEVMDVWLQKEMALADMRTQIEMALAPGVQIDSLLNAPLSDPSLQAMTHETTYMATITELGESDIASVLKRVDEMVTAEEIVRERIGKKKKVKRYDLRPLILGMQAEETADHALQIEMRLVLEPGKTGRPDEILKELGVDPLDVRIHRTKIVLGDGERVEKYGLG